MEGLVCSTEVMKDCLFRRTVSNCLALVSSCCVKMEGADRTVGGCCVAAAEETTGSGAGRLCGLVVACGAVFV